MNTPRKLTIVWLVLLAATGLTVAIGELDRKGGLSMTLALLAIAFVKSELVASHFMGLRGTSLLWRGLMMGWLILVTTLLTIAFYMGSKT